MIGILPKSHDPLIKYFAYVTLLITALMLLVQLLVSLDIISRKSPEIQIIESSVRVDIVGMPKYTLKELKQFYPEQSPPVTKDSIPEKVDSESEKGSSEDLVEVKSKNNFLKKIRQLSKTKKVKVKKSVSKKPKPKNRPLRIKNLNNLIIEGNKVSQGSSLIGNKNSFDATEVQKYLEGIPQFVKPNWKLPSYLKENNELRCRIRIFINKVGKIFKFEILESSGDGQYDQRAIDAIKRSTLPAPPGEHLEFFLRGNAILGFPL